MKKFFFFIVVLAPILSLKGQDNSFSFSEVLKVDSLKTQALYLNGIKWLEENKFNELDKTIPGELVGSNAFIVYQKGIVSKELHGKIHYRLKLEVKDNKYRYTFYDFVFHYYKQDRNYEFKPIGKTKPLADKKASGWQKTWDKHKSYTEQLVKNQVNQLKVAMAFNAASANNQKKIKEEF